MIIHLHESSSNCLFDDSLNYCIFSEDRNNNTINILDEKMNDDFEEDSFNNTMYTPLNNIALDKLITENTNYNKHEVNLGNNINNILQKECKDFKIKSIQSTNENDIDKIAKEMYGNNAKIIKETSPFHKKDVSNLNIISNLSEYNNKKNKKISTKTFKKVNKNKNRKREKTFIIFKDKLIYNNINETKNNLPKRRRKNENNNNKRKHDKLSIDNITNKIKRSVFHFARDIIKKNSNNRNIELKKFPNKTMEVLTKNKNEELFQMSLKDIFSNEKISSKYKKFDNYENKNIIDKIYEENKETKIIQILELTFQEILIIFRKDLGYIEDKEKIRELRDKIKDLDLLDDKNDKSYEDIKHLIKKTRNNYADLSDNELEEYINKITVQCCNYENWFINKVSRIDLMKEK